MNKTTKHDEIRRLIEKDKLDEAIHKLKENIEDHDLLNGLIMQSAKYSELKQLIRNDVIDFEQANISKAKIRHSLLQLINEIEENTAKPLSKNATNKKIIIFISLFIGVILMLYFSGIFSRKPMILFPNLLQNWTI